jgi:hypothetical protein
VDTEEKDSSSNISEINSSLGTKSNKRSYTEKLAAIRTSAKSSEIDVARSEYVSERYLEGDERDRSEYTENEQPKSCFDMDDEFEDSDSFNIIIEDIFENIK